MPDSVGPPPAKCRQDRKRLENMRQSHDPETADAEGLQSRDEAAARRKKGHRNGKKDAGGRERQKTGQERRRATQKVPRRNYR